MRVIVPIIVVLIFVTAAGAQDNVKKEGFHVQPITEHGEHTVFDGKLRVRVAAEDAVTKFEITFVRPFGTVAHQSETQSAVAKGWFVIAESAGRVWLYRGGDDLYLLEYVDNPPGGPAGGSTSTVGLAAGEKKTTELLANAPSSVVQRLPPSFKMPEKDK
jgi:hypothetical protein